MITYPHLEQLEMHWAVRAIDPDLRERAHEIVQARLLRLAIPQGMSVSFTDGDSDEDLLARIATAYELAAIEGLNTMLHPSAGSGSEQLQHQTAAGAYRTYEYLRVMAMPSAVNERIFHILHMSAVAYCADRWAEQRTWLNEHTNQLQIPVEADSLWDQRLLARLFDCWVRLVRKNGWDDLNQVSASVAGLRQEQVEYEGRQLQQITSGAAAKSVAFRFIALYHWARATELLARYMLQGEPSAIAEELDRHFEAARESAVASGDINLEVVVRWLHVASRKMVNGSLWAISRAVNSQLARLVEYFTSTGRLFELLPPQRAAIQREGLLDPAKRAIVVDMPTSGGKTALAQFRILQALNQFDADNGWVAYVAPTRALVAQLTRRLRRDFGPLGINVEQLSGAVEVDSYEEELLAPAASNFHIIVSTPEKLQFVIRNKKTPRPLALVVLDEAQNIEDEERGLRIELLLATIRRDCPNASFLLLMPYVPNAQDLASWLSPEASACISLSTTAWKPNDRVVGMYSKRKEPGAGNWGLDYQTLVTAPQTIHLRGTHRVGGVRPLPISFSKVSKTMLTGAIAKVLSDRTTSIAVARTIPDVWTMARTVADSMAPPPALSDEVALVQRFLATEISPKFELIGMLGKGVAVHHAGLSDETRSLIEWLAETGKLQVLCATSTIAQGMNFPVSSVFLASRSIASRDGKLMSSRDFWNLAGRAGRMDQGSIGVVGIAAGDQPEQVMNFVSEATGDLISRLQLLLNEVYEQGQLHNLESIIHRDQWRDFRSYIAHLWNEKRDLDSVLADVEQVLRNTFGYSTLQRRREMDPTAQQKARSLLDATKSYARKLSDHPENAVLADATGFAPEGVREAILRMNNLDRSLKSGDWVPDSLFGGHSSVLRDLVGVMMRIPELRGPLEELASRGVGHRKIADLTQTWVQGASLEVW